MRVSVIGEQIEFFQEILDHLARRHREEDGPFLPLANKYFCFDSEFGWNKLVNAIYIFEDTQLAILNFKSFGIVGCNQNEIGEAYLRLYGVLNALYQQSLATINMMEIFKLDPRHQYLAPLKDAEILKLRHKIAAHSSNYLDQNSDSSVPSVYEISQQDLLEGKIVLLRDQRLVEEYQLKPQIEVFQNLVEDILMAIAKKFVKKKFNNEGKWSEKIQSIERKIRLH